MEYVARHYIPLKKGLVTPGEILSDLPEEIIPRLLEKGAIEECQGAFRSPPGTPSAAEGKGKADKKPDKAAKAKPESAPEPVEDETEEVAADDAEVEEIDALSGVITAPKEEKPKTRKASSKAKGGKA